MENTDIEQNRTDSVVYTECWVHRQNTLGSLIHLAAMSGDNTGEEGY